MGIFLALALGFVAGYYYKLFSSAFHLLSLVDDDAKWDQECREMRVLVFQIGRLLGRR